MMAQLDDWLAGLLFRLSPEERKAVNRRVVYELRRRQAQRIAAQRNPDGSTYTPRSRLRGKKGQVRRKAMFAKLRTQRHLKARVEADLIEVGFEGRDAAIAAVHQDGQVRRVGHSRFVTPKRVLLGFAGEDLDAIVDAYLNHLDK